MTPSYPSLASPTRNRNTLSISESLELGKKDFGMAKEEDQSSQTIKRTPSKNNIFSPRFRSVVAMAGWDEETLLMASLIVEDTPDRDPKHNKRPRLASKTPPLPTSRAKYKMKRKSPVSNPVLVFDLEDVHRDEAENFKVCGKNKIEGVINVRKGEINEMKKVGNAVHAQENVVSSHNPAAQPAMEPGLDKIREKMREVPGKNEIEGEINMKEGKINEGKKVKNAMHAQENIVIGPNPTTLPSMDKLREELSCAICLDLCFEPSTTSCGHSFCKKCLRSAAEKCGKRCPKCRELISNGRCSNVNTVLWNTIQLLFPEEVKERIEAAKPPKRVELKRSSPKNGAANNLRSSWISARVLERENVGGRRRRAGGVVNQDADSALALRLQRDEFMGAFRNGTATSSTHTVTRGILRGMANRAARRGGR